MTTRSPWGLQAVRECRDPLIDVVFVHGIGGDALDSWKSGNGLFQQLARKLRNFGALFGFCKKGGLFRAFSTPVSIAEEHPEAKVWAYGFKAPIFSRLDADGVKTELQDTATGLFNDLGTAGIGKRPLIFVAHSLGGLILKTAIRKAREAHKPTGSPSLHSSTKAIVFIVTPHCGSSLANFAAIFPGIIGGALKVVGFVLSVPYLGGLVGFVRWILLRSRLLAQLEKTNSALLRDLNDSFREWTRESDVITKAYFETLTTSGVLVVKPCSADPGVPGCHPTRVDDANHITIAKPAGKTDLVYRDPNELVNKVEAMATAGKRHSVFHDHSVIREVIAVTRARHPKFEKVPVPLPPRLEDIPADSTIQ